MGGLSLEFRVQDSGFRVEGLGFRVEDEGLRSLDLPLGYFDILIVGFIRTRRTKMCQRAPKARQGAR